MCQRRGHPGTPEDSDTFTFTAGAGDTVFISLDLDPERDVTTYNGRIGLGVFGTPGNLLVTGDTGAGDTIDSEAIVMTVETAGTYHGLHRQPGGGRRRSDRDVQH